jgi:peptidoglycan/LPS O-acetylase OafA/YrhL
VVHERFPLAWRYDLFYVVPMALMIISFGYQNGVMSRALSNRFLVLLGDASFAFYLVHAMIILYGEPKLALFHDAPVARALVCFIVTTAVSIALYKTFELRAKRFVTQLLTRRPIRRSPIVEPMA